MNIYKKASLIIIGITIVSTTAQTVTNILLEARTIQSYIDCPLTTLYDSNNCEEVTSIVKENVKEIIISKVPEAEEALKLIPLMIYTDKENGSNEE
jgi:hypothetical protein